MKKKITKKIKKTKPIGLNNKGQAKVAERLEFIRFTALPRVFREKEWGFNLDVDFAKKFNVRPETLCAWKKDPEFWESIRDTLKLWGKDRIPDVLAGMYKKAISEGNATEVKLWLQYFDDWKEKSDVNIHYAAIKDLQDVNRQIFEEAKKKSTI
jgi:hypothetical protein